MALNLAVSRRRRWAREVGALTRLGRQRATPVAETALSPRTERFWHLVRALPARQAQVVALHYLDDRSITETAAVLGCSQATVRVHLYRARQKLAATWIEAGGDRGDADEH